MGTLWRTCAIAPQRGPLPKLLWANLAASLSLEAQRPIVIKLSRGRSVGLCVGASVCPVHCGKTADRIRMPFGVVGRTDPGIRQVVRFGNQSTERGNVGRKFGARHCNQWGLYGVGVTVSQPTELRFGVVRAVGRGIAVLDGHPHRARESGGFGGFCSPFSQWQMPLGRRRWNVSDSYAKTSQHFRSAKVSLESSVRGLFRDIFSFKVKLGVYEKLENVAIARHCNLRPPGLPSVPRRPLAENCHARKLHLVLSKCV